MATAMQAPVRLQHCCRAIGLASRSARRPGVARDRACMATCKVRAKPHRRRARPGCTGNGHAATHGNRPKCFSPATAPETSNDRNPSDRTPGTAGPAHTRRHRLPMPRATQAAKWRARAASIPPSARSRAQAPSLETMPRGSIGNAEPRRQAFKKEQPVAITGCLTLRRRLARRAPKRGRRRTSRSARKQLRQRNTPSPRPPESASPPARSHACIRAAAARSRQRRTERRAPLPLCDDGQPGRQRPACVPLIGIGTEPCVVAPGFAGIPGVSPCGRAQHEDA